MLELVEEEKKSRKEIKISKKIKRDNNTLETEVEAEADNDDDVEEDGDGRIMI